MEKVILIGIGGMLLFAIGVIIFVVAHQRRVIQYQINIQKVKDQQQQLLLHAAIESEEKERQRIAGDLHDEVGASLSTIRLYLLQTVKKKTPEETESTTMAAKDILDEVMSKVRQISHRLSPEMLMKFGLADTLKNLVKQLDGTGSIKASFICEEEPPRLSPEKELAIYRIAQEITGNLLKHANATKVTLQLRQLEQKLYFCIEDNGRGFTQEAFENLKNSPGGLGLKNIQSRINILGATLTITPVANGSSGTLTTLVIPMEKSVELNHNDDGKNSLRHRR